MGNKRSWEIYQREALCWKGCSCWEVFVVGFDREAYQREALIGRLCQNKARAKPLIFKSAKKAAHVGNKRSWEVILGSFTRVKPSIFKGAKKARLLVGNKRSVGAYLGKICWNKARSSPKSPLTIIKQAKLVLSTTLAYFYPQKIRKLLLSKARDCKPHKNASTQRTLTQKTSFRTLPESPLLSQKQAKLVFIHQSPVLTRIAASIVKTSEAERLSW